jgi:hypothetical protein
MWAQGTAFTGLRFFTAFRRIPPARPAAIRRAFLLEELSYPPASDPLSSGLGLSAVSCSSDFSGFTNFPPTHRNSPTNQVFFNEARVAFDASKRISSPSSAFAKEKKSQDNKSPARTHTLTMYTFSPSTTMSISLQGIE